MSKKLNLSGMLDFTEIDLTALIRLLRKSLRNCPKTHRVLFLEVLLRMTDRSHRIQQRELHWLKLLERLQQKSVLTSKIVWASVARKIRNLNAFFTLLATRSINIGCSS